MAYGLLLAALVLFVYSLLICLLPYLHLHELGGSEGFATQSLAPQELVDAVLESDEQTSCIIVLVTSIHHLQRLLQQLLSVPLIALSDALHVLLRETQVDQFLVESAVRHMESDGVVQDEI